MSGPRSPSRIMSSSGAGRGRLPTCVVRMRSVLRFTGRTLPGAGRARYPRGCGRDRAHRVLRLRAVLTAVVAFRDAAEVPLAAAPCFHLCSGESWRAPWQMYAALRDADPVHHVEDGDYWVLSRYSDVFDVVRDTATFTSTQGLTFEYNELAKA